MFITATEHAGLYGGYKKKKTVGLTGALPFDCCALRELGRDRAGPGDEVYARRQRCGS